MDQQKLIDLVGRTSKKDNSAMEKLYKAYYTDIMYICRKYNLNEADAADITQETFIKAFQEIGTLDNAAKFPAWLTRIATNKCINLLKHNKTLTMDTVSSDEIDLELPDKSKSSEDIVIDNEVRDILSGMIAKLPIEQRVTIFMYYYQDYSIKEIAQFYGCSENTVKSRLNYAKKAMRTEAEHLENKGIKLRVVAALPFLYMLFAGEREVFACEIPDCTAAISQVMTSGATSSVSGVTSSASTVTGMTAATQASAAAKTGFLATLGGKIAIIATAAVVVTGGVAAAITIPKVLNKPQDKPQENTTTHNTGEITDTTTEHNDSTTGNDIKPTPSAPAFDVVDIDLYNELKDSQYVSLILHDPESRVRMGNKSDGTKPVVLVYDMETSMKDTFTSPFETYVTINSFGYRFAIANDNYAIYDVRASAVYEDGFTHIAQFEEKLDKNGDTYLSWVENPEKKNYSLLDYFSLETKSKDYDYTKKTSTIQLISDENNSWYSMIYLTDGEISPETHVENIYIRLAENEEYNYYMYAPLKNPLLCEANVTETINNRLSSLSTADTIVLDTIEELGSVNSVHGEQFDVNLSDTVFYQDILASKISANYGLNLKDKTEFYWTESTYIEYIHTDNETGASIAFTYESDNTDYSEFSDYSDAIKFEYTDSDGNKFSYFSSTSGVYIFKNEEFTHTKICFQKIDDEMKWYEALGQSFGIRE